MSVHQVKALDESASGDNEAATKHMSISRRITYHSKSLNFDRVGQKFKQKVETLTASYKEGNKGMEKKAKQPMIAFFTKSFVSTSAIHCHCISAVSARQTADIIKIKTNINIVFFHNLDHVSGILGILNPIFPARSQFPHHGFTFRGIFQEQNHCERFLYV
jgi:hypothetical protein